MGISGVPGSGKSTAAAEVAARLNEQRAAAGEATPSAIAVPMDGAGFPRVFWCRKCLPVLLRVHRRAAPLPHAAMLWTPCCDTDTPFLVTRPLTCVSSIRLAMVAASSPLLPAGAGRNAGPGGDA